MSNFIHFLNTGSSDCIIVETNGHFAMVDAGEDSDYPANKPHLNYPGYEEEVCNYLLKNCASSDGMVTLDFVVGTHAHSDHIGGFDTVINHPKINVKKAYLKPYNEKDIFIYERLSWDNTEVYEQMKNALIKNNVEIVEDFDELKTTLGDFMVTFCNGKYKKRLVKYGENVNSVVTLFECNGFRCLLAGDLNNKDFDEYRLAEKIGKVDILKVGHHGYPFSSSRKWLKTLSPKYSVVCNFEKKIYPHIKHRLVDEIGTKLFCTADLNGVKFDFDNGLKPTTDIQNELEI
ncbi:MAG: MBL fold metallo-hydrolase [Eubacterium coprostanoligenes]|uniref:ComEC/Rec2 family competence protein n=1 Tax=Eubacterium coprostanoligenes TaxID=290054 RepID=UPI002357B988|nr:MBL fold metallo-hydrolase [Eubacterium coprostanoligenes]MCI7264598.1 MBL fold metallo-hydrolase [Eubacterium coprostanoligenes]